MARHFGPYLATIALLVLANFWIPRWLPGDPLSAMGDPAGSGFISNPEVRDKVAAYYGLDQPLWVQFWQYVNGLVHADLGWSIQSNQPVAQLLFGRLPWTLLLVLTATSVAMSVGLLSGVESAWRRGGYVDTLLLVASAIVRNVPIYLLAVFMLVLLSVKVGVFPLSGATQPFTVMDPWQRAADIAWHLCLPAATLALELLGGGYLLARNSMLGVLGSDYLLATRAAGLPEPMRKYRYALRNAVVPFFTQAALQVALAVTGSVFVEAVFAYPGVGQLTFQAIRFRDYPVLQGSFLVLGLWILGINALADVVLRRLDPRIRAA